MQVGLLWFDSDPGRGVCAKIQDAARRYREKFGVAADTCYVNIAVADGLSGQALGSAPTLRVVPALDVLPHHFWVGVEEQGSQEH